MKYSVALNILLVIIIGFLFNNFRHYKSELEKVGARQQYGMIGIFNLTAPTIPDGEGTALNTDSNGRLITSTTSQATLSN